MEKSQENTEDLVMTSEDIYDIMVRLLADNSTLTEEEIHLAIERAMADHLRDKIEWRKKFLNSRH